MKNLPTFISIIFGLTTLITILLFYIASTKSKSTLIILLSWMVIQSIIGFSGFYTQTDSNPPRFLLLVFPPVTFILVLFTSSKGRQFVDRLDQKTLTILHSIRIPVELVLFLLFLHKTVPQIMTFEGRNFDILSGATAPAIYYFGYAKKQMSDRMILIWNFIGLALLINIVSIAVLSAPFSIQHFAFDQPNIAVLYFPFVWLPGLVVPLVLLSHLATIRQLLKKSK